MIKPVAISFRTRAGILIAAGILGILSAFSPLAHMIDRMVYDAWMVYRPSPSLPEDIVIVAVDEPSFKEIGYQWPWPRSLHGELIRTLFRSGAAVVALDILFSEPSLPEEDSLLSEAINERTILAANLENLIRHQYEMEMTVLPIPSFLTKAGGTGIDSLPLEKDGFLRNAISQQAGQKGFAFEAASVFRAISGGNRIEPIQNPQMGINFIGPPGSIPAFSYYQALNPDKSLPKDCFKDKLVFVGFALKNAAHPSDTRPDHYPTPFVRFGYGHMAGVEIQANIASNFLGTGFIRTTPFSLLFSAAILLGALTGLLSYKMPPFKSGFMVLAFLCILAGISYVSFSYLLVFVPLSIFFFPSLFAWLSLFSLSYYHLAKEKQYIRQIFSRYVSKDVVKLLLKHPERLRLGGEFVHGTVLFLDIRNFTGLTQKLPAEELIKVLSRYLGRFTDIILENHGMIDKIAGDAIMAVWGAPVAQPDHADLACKTALILEKTCAALAEEDMDAGRPALSIRIGVNSGLFLAGNIGGQNFSDFTVHGVDVNLAKRMESLNKEYKTTILIGDNTRLLLKKTFSIRKKGSIAGPDQSMPIAVYELLGQ